MVRLKGRENWMIPILMALFALGGTTYGMAEETLAFYVLLIPVMIAAKYDALTAVAVILLGAGVGVLGSTVNAFSTVIASDAAGISLPMVWCCGWSSWWSAGRHGGLRDALCRKASGPTRRNRWSTTRRPRTRRISWPRPRPRRDFTGLHKIVLILFALTFGVMIWGVSIGGWWMAEMSGLFLAAAIVIGIVARLGEGKLVESFVNGARDLLGVALIIGLARGIVVIMDAGHDHRHDPARGRNQRGGPVADRLHSRDLLDRGGAVVLRALHLGPCRAVDADPRPGGRFRRASSANWWSPPSPRPAAWST
jgi:hypothetical protein